MENNPFNKNQSNGSYASLVRSQVYNMSIGESKQAELDGRNIPSFRMTLRYVCDDLGFKFKTKRNSDGDLWIERAS